MTPEPQDATQVELTSRTSVSVSADSSFFLDELVAEANIIRAKKHSHPVTKKQALDAIIKALSKESTVHTLTIL